MATVAQEISAMRLLRFDTEAWAALVADRLRQSGHKLSSEDLAEIRRRVDSHAAYLLSFSLLPETPSERLDGNQRRA